MESILQQIEQHNGELKALVIYGESKHLELKSGNNLTDPQVGAYYLPFGEHNTGDYTEFQISQSFEFPTVYRTRGSLIEEQWAQLELEYQSKRQEVLLQAKKYCLNLIYLNKRLNTETLRAKQAKKVLDQVAELYKKEQVGILELNKAKVAWMQEQFKAQQIQNEKNSLQIQLSHLNGNNEINFPLTDFESPLNLEEKDSLWKQKQTKDPKLLQLKQNELIAQKSLKLARSKSLPNLTVGYNNQGVLGSYYSGIYAGISLPLWSNRNKVKAAQSRVNFRQSFASTLMSQELTSFEKEYNDYQIRLYKFQEYQTTLSGLNSEELLLKAYQLGEISFLEYHMELQFYRQAYDAMLDMQYQLYLSQTELLKHQL